MQISLYVAGAGRGTGKSVVALGLMEMLSAFNRTIGFFRPIVQRSAREDALIELMRARYNLPFEPEMLYGCTAEDAKHLLGSGHYDELLKRILTKFKALEERCDLVVCAGTDYDGLVPSLEFDFNADLANNLGCLLIVVVKGFKRDPEEILDAVRLAQESLLDRGSDVWATIINGMAAEQLAAMREQVGAALPDASVYVLPEHPLLGQPTIGEIARALKARRLYGDDDTLNQVVTHFKIAAMEVPDFLNHLEDGSLIITPGDRADIILASLVADASTNFPRVAGLLLTGGIDLGDNLRRLMGGLRRAKVPIFSVDTDTYMTAMDLNRVHASILPTDDRKIAAAIGIFEANVMSAMPQRPPERQMERRTPLMFEYELFRRAKAQRRHIVLPEGEDERILRAAEILVLRDVVDLTLLGDPDKIGGSVRDLGLKLNGIRIIDPVTAPDRERYGRTYFELRRHKGMSEQMAFDLMQDVSYFGTAMVYHGDAHGMVSGAVHTTQHTIRPAFEIIKTRPGVKIVSSVFFMCLADRVLVYGDCAVNPNPNAEQLADIAISSAETAAAFGIEPRVAMLSYSTGESGKGADVDKVREATRIAHARRPDLKLEGPIQYDAAVDPDVARTKMPDNEVAGQATVFIFPDLNTGNNTYKAVQRSADAIAIGPVLQGLNKPVNDLSRGCLVADIVNTVVITAIQAQTASPAA
jgi:phosphate acetyltransferase